jgi:hypothetical protein
LGLHSEWSPTEPENALVLPKTNTGRPVASHEQKLILQTESVTLWYYPQLKLVHHRMLKPPDSAAFRDLLTKGAEVAEHFKAPKWLSDDRGNTVVREPDADWAEREWLPRVLRAGFKYWAIVLPTAAIGKLNMRRLATEHLQKGLTSAVMDTPEEAFEWLLTK